MRRAALICSYEGSTSARTGWLLLVPGPQAAYLTYRPPDLVISGIGVGLVLPSLAAAAVNRLSDAVGSVVNRPPRQIGSVLGVAVTVLLLGHLG